MATTSNVHPVGIQHPKSDMCKIIFRDDYKNKDVTVPLPDLRLFINNQFEVAQKGNILPVADPSTGKIITHVDAADEIDVHLAVTAAKNAFPAWSQMDAIDRAQCLFRLANLLEKHKVEFAVLNSLEQGKPYKKSFDVDVTYAIKSIRFAAEMADKINSRSINNNQHEIAYVSKEPVGVVACITPWNFPLVIAANKLASCVAVGNTSVLKSSEHTPLTANKLAELVKQANFPKGVINIITGYGNVCGAALSKHPHVNMISFTGSTVVGKFIMSTASEHLKRVQLELGGKSPAIVCSDADVEASVITICRSIFNNSGQCCNALSRAYVHESLYDDFIDFATGEATALKICAPFEIVDETEESKDMKYHEDDQPYLNLQDAHADQGPMTTTDQFSKAMDLIHSGVGEGATLICGGAPIGDRFIEPTIFGDVKPTMRIFKEEIFGPVLCVIKFKTNEEALEGANDTSYGLWSSVFTRSISTAHWFARNIKAGSVNVNSNGGCEGFLPFGGFKHSGIGREYGIEGLEHYTELKSVRINTVQATVPSLLKTSDASS